MLQGIFKISVTGLSEAERPILEFIYPCKIFVLACDPKLSWYMNRPIVRNKRFNFKRIDKTTDMGHELVKPKQLNMRRK